MDAKLKKIILDMRYKEYIESTGSTLTREQYETMIDEQVESLEEIMKNSSSYLKRVIEGRNKLKGEKCFYCGKEGADYMSRIDNADEVEFIHTHKRCGEHTRPKPENEFKTLKSIVEQLEACNFTDEHGHIIETNVAFIALKKMSGTKNDKKKFIEVYYFKDGTIFETISEGISMKGVLKSIETMLEFEDSIFMINETSDVLFCPEQVLKVIVKEVNGLQIEEVNVHSILKKRKLSDLLDEIYDHVKRIEPDKSDWSDGKQRDFYEEQKELALDKIEKLINEVFE